jgi:superfamily II DNA/RNA helicase
MSTPTTPHRRRRRRPATENQPPRDQHRPAPDTPSAAPAVVTTFSDNTGFTELGVPQVLATALAAAGITTPFPIQTATMADAVAGRDLLGQGRTGSGKTLAFTIPLVAQLLTAPKTAPGRPQALVLVPTRELALQVAEVISPLAAAAKRTVTTIFGGVSAQPQLRALAAGVDIVVACPGRLLDHLGTGAINLDNVRVCVLDEADHMADQGFLPMVRRILDRVPADAQKMLFSATLAGGVDSIVNRYLDNPVTHRTQSEPPARLEHRVIVVAEGERLDAVIDLIDNGRTVVFTRTKHRAKQFARKLCARGIAAVELHGNLAQNARQRNLAAFADGTAPVLVATDIAARGIHVDNVDVVIHIDPPIEHKAYTHRSGRTARAGEAGVVYTVADSTQVREVRALLTKAGVRATWTDRDGATVG